MNTVKLLILDVDGVLTDGRIVMGPSGESTKAFHVQDGCAIKLWQASGGEVAIISGRSGEATRLRAKELGIKRVHMNAELKASVFETVLADSGADETEVAYIGDDLPDLELMSRCGFPVAVSNAAPAVKRVAMYVTRRPGGGGAVGEVVELLLRKQQRWSRALLNGG
jgi:3-deoxy-D-manno-octulosonate 8-phosphate phosphatase (KDO 8-P phosphatase)